jgi:hypothetical protein
MTRQTDKALNEFFRTSIHVEAPRHTLLSFRVNRVEGLPGHFETFDAALADARRLRNGQPIGADIAMYARPRPGADDEWRQIYCWAISADGAVGCGHRVDDRVPA